MSKETDLVEGLAQKLKEYYPKHEHTDSGWVITPEVSSKRYTEDAQDFLSWLSSKGVVRIAEDQIHPVTYEGKNRGKLYKTLITKGMRAAYDKAGFVKTAPLIYTEQSRRED